MKQPGSGASVALIRPNTVIFPHSLSFFGPVPPIGLAYIAATLREAGHRVSVIDTVGEALDQHEDFDTSVGTLRRIGLAPQETVDRLPDDTEVIGVTNMFLHEWPLIREITELAKKRFPDVKIMAGGDNATAFWPWMFEQSDGLDFAVLGEGEGTAVELVDRIHSGQSLAGLQGIASREPEGGGAPCDTGLSIRSRKLSEVPQPAWDLFPIDDYLAYADFWGVHRGRSMPMIATRGCPYKCTFCSSPQMWTTKYVVRNPEEVADEIEFYVNEYGVENINFSDLTAITRRKWTLEFCDALEAKNLDITWQLPTGTRAEALDGEVLQRLWDTGCRNVTYAPESGSARMLEIYDKKLKLSTILDSLEQATPIGLITCVNIILGHPQETWRDVWKSTTFLVRAALAGSDDAAVMIFGPYPGSADWRALVDSGEVVVDEKYHYVALSRGSSEAVSYNPRMSARQLRITQMAMMILFYSVSCLRRPKRLWHYITALFNDDETTAVDQLIRVKRKGVTRLDPKKIKGRRNGTASNGHAPPSNGTSANGESPSTSDTRDRTLDPAI